ncbi:hypothetical protein MUG87_18540 [Ectobacillus sp. JY-23]|uniref:hypothetical protein n=1 Tax=Ectobacillus sp. JY-23 TaxID=2933872 RepID=UPI001FF0E074|nr:hypothetical protein [Ectobacillus sp. JY-23]UOY92396.1 hypothetical protein MUG87_18540 [Ectobacillus sp. JY-23]
MTIHQFKISLEETALLLHLKNEELQAKELLQIAFEEVTPSELEKIFITASHSLISKELVTVNETSLQIIESLDLLLNNMLNPDFSLHYQKLDIKEETMYTGHIHKVNNTLVSYQSQDGITHMIKEVMIDEVLYKESALLLDLQIHDGNKSPDILACLPAEVVENISDFIQQPIQKSTEKLIQYGFSSENLTLFLNDLQHIKYVYSIMKIETTSSQILKADQGIMILESNEHQWLLYQSDDNKSFFVSYLSKKLFERQLRSLLHISDSIEVPHE